MHTRIAQQLQLITLASFANYVSNRLLTAEADDRDDFLHDGERIVDK